MSRHKRQQGFTILELLVATAVFSMVLLVITAGILQVTRVYYKGVTESNTQNIARSVIDVISQSIQFGGGDVIPTTAGTATPSAPRAFCVGNKRYTYALGWQVVDSNTPNATQNQSHHALVLDDEAGCSASAPNDIDQAAIDGRELLGPNMRLSKLTVESAGPNLYKVVVRVVYGDNDLLKSPPTSDSTTCINERSGTQFCAISELSTVVAKRVQ